MYRFKLEVENFKLDLRSRIVAICGNSGTGKSYLCHLIESYKKINRFKSIKFGDFYLNEIDVLDYTSIENFKEVISGKKDRLVIIDNASAMPLKDSEIMKENKNCQFIVITHLPVNLGISLYYVGKLKYSSNNKYYIDYNLLS